MEVTLVYPTANVYSMQAVLEGKVGSFSGVLHGTGAHTSYIHNESIHVELPLLDE